MKLWMIEEIANGFVLTLPNGQKEFCDTWDEAMKRLRGVGP